MPKFPRDALRETTGIARVTNKAIFLRIDKLRLALQMETKREPFLFIARKPAGLKI
jgi:hypothetical protein